MPSKQPKTTNNEEQKIVALYDAKISVTAAAAGEQEKNPTVSIVGYNGGVMNVSYWGPIAINLAAMKMPVSGNAPILFAHESWGLDSLLGQTTDITNNGKALSFNGEIMAVTDTGKKIVEFARKGFSFQASVGVTPLKVRAILKDETVDVNGQTLTGPFKLIEESKLEEISIVPLGADGSTSAKIAAEQNREEKGVNMPNNKEDTPQTVEQIRAEAVAEQSRISAIKAECKDYPTVLAKAIADGWTLEKAQMEVVKAERDTLKAQALQREEQDKRPETPSIIIAGKNVKADKDSILAAACIGAGMRNPEKVFAANICEVATDLRIRSLTDLVKASLAMDGKTLNATRHDTREFIAAAFSSSSIANVLAATANKFVREGFGTVEQAWREVANVRSVVDFKANTGVRLVMSNLLQALAPTGEIKHGALSDEARTITADTKALMLGVSRKDIINDDLGVLSDLPRRLGYAAARTFNTDFWAAFVAAIAANFSASAPKSNQTTGALSLTTLAAAEALFLALKDADGNPIGVSATKLLCGTTAFQKARELYISTGMVGGANKEAASNVYTNMFKPVFSSYLPAAPWYLISDPMAMPVMEAAFLNGAQEPVVETADADFNTLGIQMRCYYDYGVAFAEYRGAVRSTGV